MIVGGEIIVTNRSNVVEFPQAARAEHIGRLLIPERLTEARLAARLTQTELSNLVKVSRQAISSYELGDKNPDPSVMQKIATALDLPIPFFTKEDRATFGRLSANFFRKIGADTKRRNQACEVYSKWLSSIAYAFEPIANYPVVDIPHFEPKGENYSEEEIEQAAEQARIHFGLGLGPISNVLRLLETRGVIVCRYKIENENIEAFSFWSGQRPFVFLASEKDSAARARFDAAHELGHLCLHRWVGKEEIEDKKRLAVIEYEANRFAGAFLLPRKSFPNEVYSPRAESFVDLKARWKVAIQAMVYRCKDLGIFDDRQITNIYKQISYKKWRKVEPLDKGERSLTLEEPLLLKKIAGLVFTSGRYEIDIFKSDIVLSNDILEAMVGVKFTPESKTQNSDFTPTLK